MKYILFILGILFLGGVAIAGTFNGVTLEGVTLEGDPVVITTGNLLDNSGNFLVTHTGDNLIYQN